MVEGSSITATTSSDLHPATALFAAEHIDLEHAAQQARPIDAGCTWLVLVDFSLGTSRAGCVVGRRRDELRSPFGVGAYIQRSSGLLIDTKALLAYFGDLFVTSSARGGHAPAGLLNLAKMIGASLDQQT